MTDKFIILDTVLGPQKTRDVRDELMPTQVSGQESISSPFVYELTMVRDPAKGLVDVRKLIGTPARFGVLAKQDDAEQYSFRTGVFQTFNRMPRASGGRLVYSGRMVPAFAMLGQRARYRVFENVSVVAVINTVLKEMAASTSLLRFDTSQLHEASFVPMEYCVQFGESDFSFLCRLMNRYGIWYAFDRPAGAPPPGDAGTIMDACNNTLVLGLGRIPKPTPCDLSQVTIKKSEKGGQVDPTPQPSTDDPPGPTELVDFRRMFEPSLARVSGADFNMLDPTDIQPVVQQVLSDYDLAQSLDDVTREDFAVRSDADPGGGDQGFVKGGTLKDAVLRRVNDLEVRTFTVAATSGNPTLLPGRSFKITDDENNVDADKSGEYLVRTTVLTAFENSYFTSSAKDFAAFLGTVGSDIVSPFVNIFTKKGVAQGLTDMAFGATQAGLNNYLQNEQAYAFQSKLYPHHSLPDESLFWPFTLGGITQGAAGAFIGLVTKGLDDAIHQVLTNNAGACSVSFVAIPFRVSTGFAAPAPKAETVVARGPHIAVVIGPEGADDAKGEVYADAIGRVRVRFAWDIAAGRWDDLGKQPLGCDHSTAWVRVADAWAGAKFGAQFLPRIGHEVVVEFLDGDPERPLVTGRLYNASTAKLPFPSPGAEDAAIAKVSDLPGTAARDLTRSGIKTRTMGGKGDAGFHMLRFDDKAGEEQLLIRSEGRLDETALRSRYETTHGARHVQVVAGKDAHGATVGGDSYTSVGGEADLSVGKDFFAAIKGKLNVAVAKDVALEFKGDMAAKVSGALSLNADTIVIEAKTQLSLKVGSSFIVVTPSGIFLNGATVSVNSGGSPGQAGAFQMTDPAGAGQADPGAPPHWLRDQKKRAGGHGGGSRTRYVDPLHGVSTTVDHGDLKIGGFNTVKTAKPANVNPPGPYVPLPPPLPPPPGPYVPLPPPLPPPPGSP